MTINCKYQIHIKYVSFRTYFAWRTEYSIALPPMSNNSENIVVRTRWSVANARSWYIWIPDTVVSLMKSAMEQKMLTETSS
jgi:hypothetical protein